MKIYEMSRFGPNFNVLCFSGVSKKIFINVNF